MFAPRQYLAVALVLSGCALGNGPVLRDTTGDAGPNDSGSRPPAGVDAGSADMDAAPLGIDGAVPGMDAGMDRADAGQPTDAGVDAGPIDAGVDAGCAAEVCDGADNDCDGAIDEEGCPCPVRVFGGHAYQFCSTAQAWPLARASCEVNGYSLAVIDSAAEDAFVYTEMSAGALGDSWVGINDRMTEGAWVWLDGIPLGYTHWDDGEPNDGATGEDCGIIMTTSGRETEWDDRVCETARSYVCEAHPP